MRPRILSSGDTCGNLLALCAGQVPETDQSDFSATKTPSLLSGECREIDAKPPWKELPF